MIRALVRRVIPEAGEARPRDLTHTLLITQLIAPRDPPSYAGSLAVDAARDDTRSVGATEKCDLCLIWRRTVSVLRTNRRLEIGSLHRVSLATSGSARLARFLNMKRTRLIVESQKNQTHYEPTTSPSHIVRGRNRHTVCARRASSRFRDTTTADECQRHDQGSDPRSAR